MVEPDLEEATKWLAIAAGNGVIEAQNWLGVAYSSGEGVVRDLGKAIEWYRRAADQGDSYAQNNIGWAFENGNGVEIDPEKAIYWYELSVDQNNSLAQHNLGYIYERGWGVTQDLLKARSLYERSAQQGNEESLFKLAKIYQTGLGVERDLVRAKNLFRDVIDGDFEEYQLSTDSKSLRRLAEAELSKVEELLENQSGGLLAELGRVGKFHALIIGNDKYQNLEDLTTPVNDARRLGELLKQRFGYEVQLLENATRSETLRALNGYRRKLAKEDNLLVYYAGHGVEDEETRIGYWQPTDAMPGEFFTAIKSDSITDDIGALKANNVLIVADSLRRSHGCISRSQDQPQIRGSCEVFETSS